MTSSRRGFTLYQLLVLLALLALLAAFFLPAIAKVRQAAARSQSQNNLKQLMLGAHNYHDVHNAMPPGVNDNHFSAVAHLLPYIEQDNLARQLDFKKTCDDDANSQVRTAVIRTLLNPNDSAPVAGKTSAGSNYLFSAGTKAALKDNDGVFYLNSKISIARIQDGTSNTIAISETLRGDGSDKAVDVKRQHVEYKADALKDLKEDAGVNDFKESKHVAGNRCMNWLDGRFLQGTFNGGRKLNDERPDVTCGGMGGWSGPRSIATVVNVALCDGSVRAVNTKISVETWKGALTTSGAEVLGNDW